MSKSIIIKIAICVLIVIAFNTFCLPVSHALSEMITQGDDFVKLAESENSAINEGALKDTSTFIYNILLISSIIIAVIVAMILGIQFMMASADEKAKVKEAILPFVVGCIVVFGSFTIWKIIVNVGSKI